MQKTILFTVILSVLFIIGCTKSTDKIFNGKDLSNWNFVVENDATRFKKG